VAGITFRLHRPDVPRSIWEFDAHSIPQSNYRYYILACPIWCIALPCLIAPALWFRKRRHANAAGFPVQQRGMNAEPLVV
jgi:hypothetical protein